MNSTTNVTSIDTNSIPAPLVFLIVTIQIIIIVVAVIGNLLVCAAVCINRYLRETASNYFLFSLAVSDILTATLSMPFDIDMLVKPDWRWDHGRTACKLWTTVYLVTVPTSILSLLAVSIDRYKAISDPLNKFRRSPFLTRKRAAFVVMGLWVYSIVFAMIPFMGWSLSPEQINIENSCVFNTPPIYSLMNSGFNFYLPLFIMVYIYYRIYNIADKMNMMLDQRARLSFKNHKGGSALRLEPSTTASPNQGQQTPLFLYSPDLCPVRKVKREKRNLKRSVKTAKSILLIVCAFFFCWIPHTTVSVTTIICTACYMSIPLPVWPILLTLGYLNSALNPLLYSLHNPKFVEAFRQILRLKDGKRRHGKSSFSRSNGGSRLISSIFHSSRQGANKVQTNIAKM